MNHATLERQRIAQELAAQHRKANQEITLAFARVDMAALLGLMTSRDQVALALMEQHGWTLADLGANALSLSVEHFKNLVKQGTYAANVGFPSMPVDHLLVVWVGGGRPRKVCRTEAEAWHELGASCAPYEVYTADRQLHADFIPF